MAAAIYKSKISTGMLLYVAGIMLTVFTIMMVNQIWVGAIVIGLLMAFVAHMYLSTWYRIEGNQLQIKCGFLYNLSLDISSIKKITETTNPISSPATSLDRLEIFYNKRDTVLISPANKMGFITHLMQLNPNIIIRLKEHRK